MSHRARGYDSSSLGYYVCYNYFIGTTGKVVQTRPDTDRTMCTRNDSINMHSVQIVLAGAFELYDKEGKDISDVVQPRQLSSLKALVTALQGKYHIPAAKVIGHKEASSTTCPGKHVMDILLSYRK